MGSTRIPQAEITGLYGGMVKRYSSRLAGGVPSPLGVYWHNRPVLDAYFSISGKAGKWDAADASLKSFAHMAVASLLGCSWCMDYGYFTADREHLDLAKVREVPRWRESDAFTSLEREVMAYAEAMTQTPPAVDDETSARLLAQLGAPALVELTAVIALANFYARSNVAFGVEADGFAAAAGLPPLAQPGRRIEEPSAA